MPLLFVYILKFSIGLALAWLFYQGVLRRLTFYGWNRWYLMGYTILCFFIPLINVQHVVENGPFTAPTIIKYIPVFHPPVRDHSWDLVLSLLAAGSVILLIRLVIGWLSVRKMRRQATLIRDRALVGAGTVDRMEIYQVDEKIVPFSFGNAIYINQGLHTEKEYEEIILHEYVHIRQRHSLDILAAEFLCVFAWYNPFAWLIRHSIRQNLEFIADGKVLEKGFDRKGYQYHLLKVIGEPKYSLATNFNFSSLKKRIVMMNKIRSARLHLVKFLFVLPLLGVLLVAFRNQIEMRAKRADEMPGAQPLFKAVAVGSKGAAIVFVAAPLRVRHAREAGGKAGGIGGHAGTVIKDSVPKIVEDSGNGGSSTVAKMDGPKLYYVDGVETSGAEAMSTDPRKIASITILKGKDAAAFGEKGRNGVILIKTKAATGEANSGMTLNKPVIVVDTTGPASPEKFIISVDSSGWVIKDGKEVQTMGMQGASVKGSIGIPKPEQKSLVVADSFEGLILLDGKEMSRSELKELDPVRIKRYNIYSGDAAVKEFGERGRQGVLAIFSK